MSRLDEISGPVDIILIRFPGNRFTGEIAPALAEVIEAGIVRILDLVFVVKDAAGDITGVEFSDLDDETSAYDDLDGEIGELLTEDDIAVRRRRPRSGLLGAADPVREHVGEPAGHRHPQRRRRGRRLRADPP